MRNTIRHSRRGFTVLELLIVIAIISLLGALAIGAVMKVRAQQDVAYTETTLKKLAGVLDQHWKAVCDQARKEYDSLPSDVRNHLVLLADNPVGNARRDDRAKLLYMKFRLKQEFPCAFEDVISSGRTPPLEGNVLIHGPDRTSTGPTSTFLPTTKITVGGSPFTITAKPAYFKAVKEAINIPRELESSILLTMALEQSRAGVPAFNMEQLVGARFIANQGNFRYLIDTWGKPLQFFTFPSYQYGSNLSSTDLDVVRTTTPYDLAKEVQDPSDPERLLVRNYAPITWNLPTGYNFEQLLHRRLGPMDPNPAMGAPVNRRLTPVIASAGVDGDIGGTFTDPNYKWMTLPRIESTDNIYSYRLRQTGARGD